MSCGGCGAGGRREFLRELSGLAMLIVVGRPGAATSEVEYPVPGTDGALLDRDNQVIVVRYGGACYAFALSCPHQNTALKWQSEEARFHCPKHKSRYAPDGTFLSGRATRHMDRLPIRRVGDKLLVNADRVYESDKDAAGWAAASVAVGR